MTAMSRGYGDVGDFEWRSATLAGLTKARVTVPRPISAVPLCALTRKT
jgi:hypothetical protein